MVPLVAEARPTAAVAARSAPRAWLYNSESEGCVDETVLEVAAALAGATGAVGEVGARDDDGGKRTGEPCELAEGAERWEGYRCGG